MAKSTIVFSKSNNEIIFSYLVGNQRDPMDMKHFNLKPTQPLDLGWWPGHKSGKISEGIFICIPFKMVLWLTEQTDQIVWSGL